MKNATKKFKILFPATVIIVTIIYTIDTVNNRQELIIYSKWPKKIFCTNGI